MKTKTITIIDKGKILRLEELKVNSNNGCNGCYFLNNKEFNCTHYSEITCTQNKIYLLKRISISEELNKVASIFCDACMYQGSKICRSEECPLVITGLLDNDTKP